jgi:hypothetical protein
MQEFLCCEELPKGPTVAHDLLPSKSDMFLSSTFFSVHPAHLFTDDFKIVLYPKSEVSVLDFAGADGGYISTNLPVASAERYPPVELPPNKRKETPPEWTVK